MPDDLFPSDTLLPYERAIVLSGRACPACGIHGIPEARFAPARTENIYSDRCQFNARRTSEERQDHIDLICPTCHYPQGMMTAGTQHKEREQ